MFISYLDKKKEAYMGIVTEMLGLLMVLWALPAQFIKIHREKKCGVVPSLIALSSTLYVVRAVYAAQREAWGIVIPDTIGFAISLAILTQWFIYRKR
jgi:hypothetical protein